MKPADLFHGRATPAEEAAAVYLDCDRRHEEASLELRRLGFTDEAEAHHQAARICVNALTTVNRVEEGNR